VNTIADGSPTVGQAIAMARKFLENAMTFRRGGSGHAPLVQQHFQDA
jgi:hypothetical protein